MVNNAQHDLYDLDDMHIDHINWRSYRHFSSDDILNIMKRRLWTSLSITEWCYLDRVIMHFGFMQDIPNRSPRLGHDVSHVSENWATTQPYTIEFWKIGRLMHYHLFYMHWLQIMSGYMIMMNGSRVLPVDSVDVRRWMEQDGFQGSQSFHGGGGSSRRGRPKARPIMPKSGKYLELVRKGCVPWHKGTSGHGSHIGGCGA